VVGHRVSKVIHRVICIFSAFVRLPTQKNLAHRIWFENRFKSPGFWDV